MCLILLNPNIHHQEKPPPSTPSPFRSSLNRTTKKNYLDIIPIVSTKLLSSQVWKEITFQEIRCAYEVSPPPPPDQGQALTLHSGPQFKVKGSALSLCRISLTSDFSVTCFLRESVARSASPAIIICTAIWILIGSKLH